VIYRSGERVRISCAELDFFFDDLTDYVVLKVEKMDNGDYLLTLLGKRIKRRQATLKDYFEVSEQ
jgi:hypothetical protein